LSPSDPDKIAIDFVGDVVAGFPDAGLRLFQTTGNELFLTDADPSLLATNR
jgi:hypothetical protein